jgi:predicted amidohydrolase YtcJ
MLLTGGTILTGDPARPRAGAVAVAGGRVVALDDEARARHRPGDEVVDLAGGCLVPGFHDGHVHPLWGGTGLAGAPVAGAGSVEEVLAAVRDHAAARPGPGWVVGAGYDPALLPGALGDAEVLDRAVADRPVLLWAADHHTAWVNSAALAAAGIDERTPDPPGGVIARRGDGRPLGALLEEACDLVARLVPAPTPGERADGLRRALRLLAAAGVTWAQDASLAPEDVGVYLDVAAAGHLTTSVNVALRADPDRWRDQLAPFAEARATAAAEGRDLVSARTVKLFADGVVESGTAAMLEPYDDAPHSCGIPFWDGAELAAAVTAFDGAGFQVHVHAIGDAGVRSALDAVEAATAANGERDRRPVVAHTQVVHPDDLPRFAALGVVANFEPLWAQPDAVMLELTEPRLGPERSRQQYPIGAMARSGATVTFGSDWPVSSLVPMEGIAVAVTRQTPEGEPPAGWLPEQRLPVGAAMAAYTAAGAHQAFAEAEQGTITPGRRADLCLLGADPTAVPPSELATVPVEATWLGGTEVHRS